MPCTHTHTLFELQLGKMEFKMAVVLFIIEGWQHCSGVSSSQQHQRPHIVFIMADDLVMYENE
jgi:hypothetical protein